MTPELKGCISLVVILIGWIGAVGGIVWLGRKNTKTT